MKKTKEIYEIQELIGINVWATMLGEDGQPIRFKTKSEADDIFFVTGELQKARGMSKKEVKQHQECLRVVQILDKKS